MFSDHCVLAQLSAQTASTGKDEAPRLCPKHRKVRLIHADRARAMREATQSMAFDLVTVETLHNAGNRQDGLYRSI
jgi:hypothetical protein